MKRMLLLLLFLPVFAAGQTINTFTGNGVMACCFDGGTADSGELYNPTGVAIDNSGNLFIADFGNSRIRKVTTSGIITTIAGSLLPGYSGDGGQATDAQLNQPWGVAVDISGNVFISEYGNNVIRKVNTAGIITTIAGNGTIGYSGDGRHADSAEFHKPRGIAVDHSGNLFIADPQNNVIRKVNASGIISTVAGNGAAGYTGDGIPATAAGLNAPFGVSVDNSGSLFIADWNNFRIRKVDAAGIITTVAGHGVGGYSGDGLQATLAGIIPVGVNVDDSGNIYFPDAANSVIRRINAAGIITTIAGNGSSGYSGDGGMATAAMLHSPYGVAGDAYTNLFIADQLNNRIRKVTWQFAASFTVSADTICQDSCITFINTSTGIVDSIRWIISGITLPDPHSDTINVCFPLASIGTVKLYAYDSGHVDSSTRRVNIKRMPHPVVTDSFVCGFKVPEIYLSYKWYYDFDFTGDSTYYIMGGCSPCGGTYVVVDSNGCLGSSNGGVRCPDGIITINNSHPDLNLFPNPATNALTITGSYPITNICISNLLGQSVFSSQYSSENVQINVTDLSNGVYFIKINDTEVRKFEKQ